MPFSIALTLAQRDNLLSLQGIERNQAQTQKRLSSGRRVNDVTDDVFRYFAARQINDRAGTFLQYQSIIEQAISALKVAVDSIDSLTKLFEQIRGTLHGASGQDQNTLSRTGLTIEHTLAEVGNIVLDSHYGGVNLLLGTGQGQPIHNALSVRFSDRHVLGIASVDIFRTDGGVAGGSVLVNTNYNNRNRFISFNAGLTETTVTIRRFIRDDLNLYSSLEQTSGRTSIISTISESVSTIITNLNTRAQQLGNYIALLHTRSDFSHAYATELAKGTDKYTLADINQEGAHLVALQTRQQLSLNALSVSGNQQQLLLVLFL